QVVCTILIARILTPHDFGVVGMLLIFYSLALAISESGLGQALIREQETDDLDYSSVFYFNVIVSVFLYALLFASSSTIADFFNESVLEKISKVIFLAVPISSLFQVQNAIMAIRG